MHTKLKNIIITIGYFVYKIIRTPIKWYWKIFKIKTRGVRVMIIYKDELVLVRHWYNSLWVMPGGGIKKNETPEQAAIREIKEEIGIDSVQLDYLLGEYSNTKEGKNDTVYCFVVELDSRLEIVNKKFNIEISDSKWCSFSNLPENTSRATKDRIIEYVNSSSSKVIRPW